MPRHMRQKELRIALVCYGGISLAVYMHGVTKELWKLIRASRATWSGEKAGLSASETVYVRLLQRLESHHDLKLRVLTDIVAGASAGGINGVFLAQAIHSGQSLEPLTNLWLDRADVDVLLDPDARPWSRFAKFWATPIVWWLLRRPGNAVSDSVAPETRHEVRTKLSRLIRSRWFEPPFGGLGFSHLLCEAMSAMRDAPHSAPLLPPGHPLDLFVTATDFKGHVEGLRLHSPPLVEESEHRLSLGFRAVTPARGGAMFASPLELVFAARATASFPGAFPPLRPQEIDRLAAEQAHEWPGRDAFLARIMPEHVAQGNAEDVALIDGSVLVNAPFAEAMSALRDRPAHREVDRRFVYIDPRPDRIGGMQRADPRPPGFFSVIFGSISSIPREQPVRDNLDLLARQSAEMAMLREIVGALRPDVERAVDKLFGHTLFFDKPTVRRLSNWRRKAHSAAAEQSGYSYQAYAQVKFAGLVNWLARTIQAATPELGVTSPEQVAQRLRVHLAVTGLSGLSRQGGGPSPEAIAFFKAHDLPFRVRRLRLVARRLTEEWVEGPEVEDSEREKARDAVYGTLSLYFDREAQDFLGEDFPAIAAKVFEDPGHVLEVIASRRQLVQCDLLADAMIAGALAEMPSALRRHVLLVYLGFPFYDTATLPVLRGEGLTEFDPVKVDRISPDDARSIRAGGTHDTLRGVEFYNFGAFFSRAYRENDYLWGRLHGAERMIDLVASTLPDNATLSSAELQRFKHEAFLAILDEEASRLLTDPALVPGLRAEVEALRPQS